MRISNKGFVLALVLLLSVIMLILGMAFIGSRALLYQGSSRVSDLAQAKALAEAGLEDARVKLDKDPDFPPPGRDEQDDFSYSEDVQDISGRTVGYYEVLINSTHRVGPYSVLRIKSIGRVGPREEPFAQHSIEAELDVSAEDRSNPTLSNPRHFQFQRWDSSQNP